MVSSVELEVQSMLGERSKEDVREDYWPTDIIVSFQNLSMGSW